MKYILLCIISLFLFSCESLVKEVKYEITGDAHSVSLTYANASEGTEQRSNIALPGTITFKSRPGNFLYMSAQNQGESGCVTVKIYVDGKVFKKSTSCGEYVIAEANGSCPF